MRTDAANISQRILPTLSHSSQRYATIPLERLRLSLIRMYNTQAKHTRKNQDLGLGPDFEYLKVPLHLIPRVWTNDPLRLGDFVKWGLEKDFARIPETCIPILHHKEGFGLLAMAQGEVFLHCVGSIDHAGSSGLYRFASPIELTQLLQHIQGQAVHWSFSDEYAVPFPNFLTHAELEWDRVAEAV